jgi:transposase
MNNIYSCRKVEKQLLENIHYMWLSGNQTPDFSTINNFRSLHLKATINHLIHNYLYAEQKKRFRENAFISQNLFYNQQDDYFVCLMGQHLEDKGATTIF